MSTQAIAIASQFAALEPVQDLARALAEPSLLLVGSVALAGVIAGRFILGTSPKD